MNDSHHKTHSSSHSLTHCIHSVLKLGKLSFKLDNLVGKTCGSKFEVVGKDLMPVSGEAEQPQADEGV